MPNETAMPADVMATIAAAVQQGHDGDRTGARQALTTLWDTLGDQGDALHRCTTAHYLADLQDDVTDELTWDQRALAAATTLTDARTPHSDARWQLEAMLPSLHLNLADAHRRLGHTPEARHHLTAATTGLDALPADNYGTLIRTGTTAVRTALDAGSTAPLATP